MEHYAFHTLVDYAMGKTPTGQTRAIAAHLETCATCQTELAAAQRLLDLPPPKPLEEVAPSPGLIERATAAFRRRQREVAERLTTSSTLEFDSLTDMALGVRGVTADRQLLYEAGHFDVDLQIVREPESKQLTLHGQILAEEEADVTPQPLLPPSRTIWPGSSCGCAPSRASGAG